MKEIPVVERATILPEDPPSLRLHIQHQMRIMDPFNQQPSVNR